MPRETQFAPAFGMGVGDAGLDGHQDLFLAQNFFVGQPYSARLDAGRGLWLRGTGEGRFEVFSGQASGVRIYGEQRGAALGDFDGDAWPDLVVTQNGERRSCIKNRSRLRE